jgi:hypothetical protein
MGDSKGMAQFRCCRLPSLKASLFVAGVPILLSLFISIFILLRSPADIVGTIHGSTVGIGMMTLGGARQVIHICSERLKALLGRGVGRNAKGDILDSCVVCKILTQSALTSRINGGIRREF